MNNNSEKSQRRAVQFKRLAYSNRLSGRIVFHSFLASLLALVIPLSLASCKDQVRNFPVGSRPENQMNSSAARPLIDPEFVRREIERHGDYKKLLKTFCPRRVIDRHEEMRRYPAIDVLHRLKYATVTDDTSRRMYEKVIEFTFEGRRVFANYTKEESDRYIITLARREYLTGSEKMSKSPKNDDLAFVNFRWQWKALNPLGKILSVRSEWRDSEELSGWARFQRTAEGWRLIKLDFEDDHQNYLDAT